MLRRPLVLMCGPLVVVVTVVAVAAIGSTPVFLPAVLYESGARSPSGLTLADLNRDGIEDVVLSHLAPADGTNDTIGMLIGKGDGTFAPVATAPAGANAATFVVAGDLNADGSPDLVVGTDTGAVTVLLGNGNGTFRPPKSYPSGGTATSIVLADLDGDAKLDAAVAHHGAAAGTVDVLFGDGDGTLRSPVSYASGGATATDISAADLNRDGKPDLVVSSWTGFGDRKSGVVDVFLGRGDGLFQKPLSYSSGGFGASSLAISDVNGDGFPDVVVANCDRLGTATCSRAGTGHGVVGVLLANGDGALRAPLGHDLGGLGAGAVAVADVDGDGAPDILAASCAGVSCSSAVAVLAGEGDGDFHPPVSYDSGGSGAGPIRVADVNSDGRPDALTTTCASADCKAASLTVLVNDAAAAPPRTAPAALEPSMAQVSAIGAVSASGSHLISDENAKPGTAEWRLTNHGSTSRVIEGYASLTSVPRGGRIDLFVSTAAPSYTMDIFRMGYYGGLGGRRMMPTITRTGRLQPECPMDSLGMIECAWADPYSLVIPHSADATDWMSGFYLVKLTESVGGRQQYITFTVRDDDRATDLILVQGVNTYQAYNVWGGKSLYGTLADRDDHANAARRVSFNRPYYGEGSYGASGVLGDEAEMCRWLEREGYDVSYATNVDLDENQNLLLTHRAFLAVGHDEYWTKAMFDHTELARDSGVSLGFFAGNSIYWQVRYEPSIVGQRPRRSMVGYKSDWRNDPMLAIDPAQVTGRWRDAPVNRPEDALQGVLFITQARPVMVIEDASHWAFTDTGLKNGDKLTEASGTPFLGYEVDQMGTKTPANTRRLAHSPVTARGTNYSDVTIYRAPSGATVFAIGSISWTSTVPQIQQMTRNVLARLIVDAFPDTPAVRPALPSPFSASDVGNVGRQGFVALAGPDSFTLNGAGIGANGTDAFYYVHQALDGDGEMTVRMTTLQKFDSTRAGIMIRETLAPTARYVSLLARPSEISRMPEGVELHVKEVAGAKRVGVASRDQSQPNWMRLRRTGNTFEAFSSADGVTWTSVGSTTLAIPRSAFVGVAVYSGFTGLWTTGTFDNVRVTRAALPSPWLTGSVGTVSTPTSASYATGFFTVDASGSQLWADADGFGCAYQSWTGDGDLIARVATLTLPSGAAYASAGIMFRDGLGAGAVHASIVIGTDGKLEFRRRKTIGGATLSDGPSAGTTSIPRWLKLSRRGTSFSAFYSQDGASWTSIPVTDSVPLPNTVFVGMLALRNGGTTSTRATFSNVSLARALTDADIGTVGTAGSSTAANGRFDVRGGGTDIYGNADAFHFVYQQWTGDGTFVTRLASLTNATGATFSLGAIMFRESLAADSRHAAMMITTDGKAKFRRRTTTAGTTLSDGPSAGTTTVPRWLKLVRSGSSFSAFISADGVVWTQVTPATTIAMPATVYVGMLALRNGGSALTTAAFTNVSLTY